MTERSEAPAGGGENDEVGSGVGSGMGSGRNDLETVLAACLDGLASGRDTVDGCLARHPALAGELGPVLRAAAAVRALPPVAPSPAFRAVAGARMQRLIAAQQGAPTLSPAPRPAPAPLRQPLWRSLAWRLAAAMVGLSLLGGGVALASADSLPDQPLYGVKLATERLQVTLAPAEEKRFEVLLQQADRRLAEATAMVLAGKYERAFAAMTAYDLILRDMARTVNQAQARGKDIAPLVLNFQQHITRQQAALQLVYNKVPPRARAAVQRVINAAIEAQNAVVEAIVTPRPVPRPTMTPV